ncbi:MAG: tRNA lysidine(34) synthetase TilS [Firmicutes bacterium HGW-Firmicutes-12]|jgi:tRNA(Ile)-lysidine synthase|nr:MAG: tRNA lysidine(34) synthetase TilS [Firmicutes bacterium HGW-Firmicutes-12]
METIYDKVVLTIKQYNMIEPDELVIVGVSGGPDSIAMLHILARLQKGIGFKLHVAHLDHSFRGKQAEDEAIWVKSIAESWGITCTLAKQDVSALAKEKRISTQDAGHLARKDFFLSLLEKMGAQKLALGHQANDQAETMLMHFLTGAGSEGLSGILPRQGPFIRPLLFVERAEIEKYCLDHNLDPRRDPSNEKDIYLRNKIRNQLLPWLTENINPNLINTLNRTSQIFLFQEQYLQAKTNKAALKCILQEEQGTKIILESFSKLPLALQRRLIRSAYQTVGKKQGIQFKHVEEVRELLLNKQVGKVLHLPDDIKVIKEYESVVFYRGDRHEYNVAIKKRVITVPGDIAIPEIGQIIKTGYTDRLPEEIPKNEVYLPWEEFSPPLYVRSRLEGDKFSPYGYNKSRKLKEYFIDKKIPRKIRDSIPVITDQKGIMWIAGMDFGMRVNKKSRLNKYVVIKIEKEH